MSDIVERLMANVNWLMRDGFETSAKNVQCALSEIESLRQQLAEKDAEIEKLRLDFLSADNQAFDSWQQLAASQAREQQLREAIDNFGHSKYCSKGIAFVFNKNTNVECTCQMRAALAQPTDTTALEAMIAKAGEVMRDRAFKQCSILHGEYAFSAEEIRALPGVTLEDLKI